jgi:hypothetical protein
MAGATPRTLKAAAMGWDENSLFVDDWGIRVGGVPNGALLSPYRAFPWGAVNQLSGYTVEEPDKFLVLRIHHGDSKYGSEEVLSDWEDFPAVATGISTHLPGLRPDWLDTLFALSPEAGPLTIWSRSD